MLSKRIKLFTRRARSRPGSRINDDHHVEKVQRESWVLFGFIPVYSRETILAHNL